MFRSRFFLVAALAISLSVFLLGPTVAQEVQPGRADAAVSTSFTYQGSLTDSGSPANGLFDFRFILYNAGVGGAQVGSTSNVGDVTVSDGLFNVALDFGAVFDGVAVWLEIAVRPGASTGAYTILSPRQALTATPYALGLLGGARINNPSGSGLVIESSSVHGLLVQNSGGDGLFVCATGTETDCTSASTNNGVEIGNAQHYGVVVNSAGIDGVWVNSAGNDGVFVGSTGLDGLYVASAGRDGVVVNSTGRDGVVVNSADRDGLRIDHAAGDGIFICSTGNKTGCTPSTRNNGVEIGNAQHNGVEIGNAQHHGVLVNSAGIDGVRVGSTGAVGVYVGSAGRDGVFVASAGSSGVYVNSAANDGLHVGSAGAIGVRVSSAGSEGIHASGDILAGHFTSDIQVDGNCTGCTLATFAVNSGDQALLPGDIVTILGTQPSGTDGVPMLMQVSAASAGQPLVGVVDGRAEIRVEAQPRSGDTGRQLIPREGAAQPGDYVTIIIYGPVQVKADPVAGSIAPGARLTLDSKGRTRGLRTVTVDGVQLAESAPVIGLSLSAPDAQGMIWALVNPQ